MKYGPPSELLNASTNATQVPVAQVVSPNDEATTHDSMPARTYWLPVGIPLWFSDPLESWMYSDG